jgi:hypothetical protein
VSDLRRFFRDGWTAKKKWAGFVDEWVQCWAGLPLPCIPRFGLGRLSYYYLSHENRGRNKKKLLKVEMILLSLLNMAVSFLSSASSRQQLIDITSHEVVDLARV